LYQWPQLPALSWVRALWKRKLLIAFLGTGLGVLATAIALWLPAVYRAEVLVLVESQRVPERFVTSTVSADLNDRLSTLRQQIMSYARLLGIINKYGLYREERGRKPEEEVIELMRERIFVSLDQGWSKEQPGAFRIAYEAHEAAVAAQVANELAELFIDQNLRSREVRAVGTSEFLQSQVDEAKKRLEGQEALLGDYKRKHNGELPQQETTLNAALARLQVQLQGVYDEISRTGQTKTIKESELSTAEASQSAFRQMTEQLSAVGPRREAQKTESAAEVEMLEKKLEALRARYTGNHPDVRETGAALARLRERLARGPEADSTATGSTSDSAADKPAASQNQVLMSGTLVRERERVEQLKTLQTIAGTQLEHLDVERQRILREIAAVQARLSQLPMREQQIAAIARDYEISRANYQSLLDKKLSAEMATELEKNQKSERFTVLDAARVPEEPVKPDRLVIGLLGWALGLVLAVVAALLVEFNTNVVLGEWELPRDTPILGRVPVIVIRKRGAREAA
jgi:polysaccharide chain length determinant protein (PEP-CTERM system associated)